MNPRGPGSHGGDRPELYPPFVESQGRPGRGGARDHLRPGVDDDTAAVVRTMTHGGSYSTVYVATTVFGLVGMMTPFLSFTEHASPLQRPGEGTGRASHLWY